MTEPNETAEPSGASGGSLAWIPVAERLPRKREWIIVCRAGSTFSLEAMHHSDGTFMRGNSQVHPTHWMPLPAPPQGGN